MERKSAAYYLRKKAHDLIVKVCQLNGEDEAFTKEYAEYILALWKDDLKAVIICFEDLRKQRE